LNAQSCQKSYTDMRRRPLEFEVGDHVYLWVSPMKDVHRFGIKGKLAPRYIGSYPIIGKYGPTSYQVELPSKLSGVHNMFHVWSLRLMLLLRTSSHWKQIWHTRHTPPRFLTNKTESRPTRLLGSTRFSGMIILRIKLCGNMKSSCDPITLTFFRQGNRHQTSPAFTVASISGQDSLLRGGGVVTPCVTVSPIIIIKGLIIHQMP
jgi:hypothetical protein